ncbi:Gfo/Idh/MocA family protein [Deinococcus cellulosilyticus]|uniref:Dehydrogenase n=1 Tax=Deinococcus cellulosilyticus (strain DSM 18568 / NBRC 106333 / KACC 11606 / 5516J-15) TaxID=1223518 RepID=A0A511NA70_DEIC1|nr:Gfo/Idh/MocA family oxidoreductase [Deinococcus cellulosilyticus]GEM49725.1 dehydrogenase [Deinococcus cellulosilyticus NBRC 106333 = KACC 11606]
MKHAIGIIGAGNISSIYLENASRFRNTRVLAIADLNLDRARAQAEKYGVPHVLTVDELLAHPEIEAVVNLTIPAAHAEIALRAVRAGKHVYNEKPLSIHLEEARQLLEEAKANNVRVGCAPDTFLGGGLQNARKLLDEGLIGEVIGFHAAMLTRGPESWHPDPEFFYQPGAGPLFDMGPYYLTAIAALLGPVHSVVGFSRASFPERTIGSGAKQGQQIQVNTPTHVTASLQLHSGVIGTLTTSFDTHWDKYDTLIIYGTDGTLVLPDPNSFGGVTKLWKNREWTEIQPEHGFTQNSRGVGLSDLLYAHDEGRSHRASGDLAYHVLEAMHAILESSEKRAAVELGSAPERPEALAVNASEEMFE